MNTLNIIKELSIILTCVVWSIVGMVTIKSTIMGFKWSKSLLKNDNIDEE